MLTEEGCHEAWSVLRGTPTPTAQARIDLRRRRRRALTGLMLTAFAAFSFWWLIVRDWSQTDRTAPTSLVQFPVLGLALALLLLNLVLNQRHSAPASEPPSPEQALTSRERRALGRAIASAETIHAWWLPIAVNVAQRRRRQLTSLLGAGGIMLLEIGIWLSDPSFGWPLVLIAVPLLPIAGVHTRDALQARAFLRRVQAPSQTGL